MLISQLFSSSLVAKQICEKTALDTSLKDSVLDKKGIQTEEKRSEEMEVRNTVGAGEEMLTFSNYMYHLYFLLALEK